jgi:uncharacterized protein YcbX
MEATVESLYIYPLKSCQGVSLTRARLTPEGLELDRQWCVVDGDGFVQDLRVNPKLATIEPSFSTDGSILKLTPKAETGLPVLELPVSEAHSDGEVVEVSDRYDHKWFGKSLRATSTGQVAAAWITKLLEFYASRFTQGTQYRIVRYNKDAQRRVNEAFKGKSAIAKRATATDTTAFADCAPYHLASQDSLADLNRRLQASGAAAAEMARFRPNIVVQGSVSPLAPYAEDSWALFTIGEGQFRQLGQTARCVIPSVHPTEGVRDENENPREMLTTYRDMPYGDGPHGGPAFGVWLACDAQSGTEIVVGQPLLPSPPGKAGL